MGRAWKLRWQQVAGDSSKLKAINFDPKQRPRRQDWSGELVETGMFYFIRRHLIERDGLLQNERFVYTFQNEFVMRFGYAIVKKTFLLTSFQTFKQMRLY